MCNWQNKTKLQPLFLLLTLLFVLPCVMPSVRAEPVVIASIAPVHSLVQAILGSRQQAGLLIPAELSPHQYQLKPSDARRLQQADLVIWVGSGLENRLQQALHTIVNPNKLLTLSEQPTLRLLPLRQAEEHTVTHAQQQDPHLWLAPNNAAAIVDLLLPRIIELNPTQAEYYRANAAQFQQQLQQLDQSLKQQLSTATTTSYLIQHDVLQYFTDYYRLPAPTAVIRENPARTPGARHLTELYEQLDAVDCIFIEPQYAERTFLQEVTVPKVLIDALGMLQANPIDYLQILQQLTTAWQQCGAK